MAIKTDYLSWFKDMDARLSKSRGVHSLISSNLLEPLDLLERHIRADWDGLRRLQAHNNDWGHPVLKQRIAAYYRVKPECILLANGCTNANFLAISSLVRPGESVVCERPSYQPLWQAARHAGAGIKWLRRRPPDYGVDTCELSRLVDRRTSLVLLTNLHNPSGTYLDEENLKEIARTVRRKSKHCRILVDEVFGDLYPDKKMPACVVDPIFVTTGSLSKAYGLSHLECGWVMADARTIDKISKLFMLAEGNGSRYLESLSAIVFHRLDEYRKRASAIVEKNRQALSRAMASFISQGILDSPIPQHGCIWFPGFRRAYDSYRFCRYAARYYGLYLVPGCFFGDGNRFRIGFGGDPDKFGKAIQKLAEAVGNFSRRGLRNYRWRRI